ncbi:MAG TPA: amidohydrolase family protein [Vicinamibacterales bacterium]
MTRSRVCAAAGAVVALALLAGGQVSGQGGQQAEQEPTLSITEYKPKSTLVVPEHPVPRAKFPVIDVHSHHPRVPTGQALDALVAEMDALNLRALVNLSGGTGERLRRGIETIRNSRHADRMVFFANLDFSDLDQPGYGERAAARLEADVKAGAVGLKIFKNFGLHLKRKDGTRVPTDDPEFDPIWAACARLGIPVLIHTGEPLAFFEPVDRFNERWRELQLRPQNRLPPDRFPTFDALMAERDRLFAKHPKTTFIVAHFGWHANDLARLGRMLDRLPNTVVETGAILHELGRQPRTARAFFVKYQDRILFGKDRYEASEFPYYFRVFETEDEYFDYYRDYHAFWKLYGMGLPDAVLKKVYFENAQRVVPGLPRIAS